MRPIAPGTDLSAGDYEKRREEVTGFYNCNMCSNSPIV